MMEGNLMVDENLSVLTTCASADQITRNETTTTEPLYSHHSSASTNQPPPPPSSKKKRNLPGNPDPGAEVIALSPKALLATNRFICEICNKGFQRDQNLQLHRRGHNLPWKLKQRGNKEVRKKVYVCPEPTCVHNHPSRALGDLTGIKKHFCRKHGEKKWKCEKCSKRYAVQSDWKAHSKICGTREYRCDCGTLFSRRDSFITHRAFCDALAQESTAVTTSSSASAIINSNNNSLFSSLLCPNFPLIKTEESHHFFSPQLIPSSNDNNNPTLHSSSLENGHGQQHHPLLLQQNPNPNPNPTPTSTPPIGFGLVGLGSSSPLVGSCTSAWDSSLTSPVENPPPPLPLSLPPPLFHHMMSFEEASFEEALNGILMNRANKDGSKTGGGRGDGETRDFLGLRALARSDHIFQNEINDMSNLNSSSPFGLHQNHQTTQMTFWRH